jgi:hypothetical protein
MVPEIGLLLQIYNIMCTLRTYSSIVEIMKILIVEPYFLK